MPWTSAWRRASFCTLGALALFGCGAVARSSDSCEYAGTTHADGASFPDRDGCNTCGCNKGQIECTLVGCGAPGCAYDGKAYQMGDAFPASDGCNSCSCSVDGVTCTEKGCESCESINSRYGALMDSAKACEPGAPDQCTRQVVEGLTCGCETYVTGSAWQEAEANAIQNAYTAANCGVGSICGPCNPPLAAHCSTEGRCVDDYEPGRPGPSCKVNGVVYPNGAGGIPDPVSCNLCECEAGQLVCTEKGCPRPCPDGTQFGESCAQCGPVDNCLVAEYGCMPSCVGSCEAGSCSQGVCVWLCG